MTRCESYPPCFGTIYFPTAPFLLFLWILRKKRKKKKQYLDISVENIRIEIVSFTDSNYMLI